MNKRGFIFKILILIIIALLIGGFYIAAKLKNYFLGEDSVVEIEIKVNGKTNEENSSADIGEGIEENRTGEIGVEDLSNEGVDNEGYVNLNKDQSKTLK